MKRPLRPAVLLAMVGLLLSGCTSGSKHSDPGTRVEDLPKVPTAAFKLAAFDTCETALNDLRTAADKVVGPYGLPGMLVPQGLTQVPMPAGGPEARGAMTDGALTAQAGAEKAATVPNFSGTNTHEVGVDEPDIVKTDGRRVIVVSEGWLRVIDAATHKLTGSLYLSDSGANEFGPAWADNLLLAGDRALVLYSPQYIRYQTDR